MKHGVECCPGWYGIHLLFSVFLRSQTCAPWHKILATPLHISAVNYPISSNLLCGCGYLFYITRILFDKKLKFCKFKMADERHILKIVFFAISLRHIGWLMRTLDRRWRITCGYRSRDQNGNFHKFKMADGHHIENRFWLYLVAILADVCENWIAEVELHANYKQRSRFQNISFRQFNTAAAAMLKVIFRRLGIILVVN